MFWEINQRDVSMTSWLFVFTFIVWLWVFVFMVRIQVRRDGPLETLSWPSSTLHIVPCRLPSVYINSDQLFSIYINVNRVCKIIVYYGNSLNQKIYISTRHIRWVLQCNDNLYSSGDVEKKILYLIPVLSAVTAYKVFYL